MKYPHMPIPGEDMPKTGGKPPPVNAPDPDGLPDKTGGRPLHGMSIRPRPVPDPQPPMPPGPMPDPGPDPAPIPTR